MGADVVVVVSSCLVEVSVVISDEVVRGEVVVIVVDMLVVGVVFVVVVDSPLVIAVVVVVEGDMEVVGMAGHITSAPAMESSLN